MKMTLPKVILFDWDNTLVDTAHLVLQALNHAFCKLGLPTWDEAKARKLGQYSGRDSAHHMFGDRWQEGQGYFYDYYDSHAAQGIQSLPGAQELLQTIQNLGIASGVVSNKRGYALRQEISHMGWQQFFSAQVGAGDALKDKPAADPILLALDQMGGIASENVWFVGDAPVDWMAAEAAGCWPVPIGDWHGEVQKFAQAVANCHDLEKILLRI